MATTAKNSEQDYVLGTHDAEIERLGLQHRVWRPRALDAWRRAGFTVDQTLLDIGCGPGYATIDLAEIVGPRGRVVAIDRSHRFLQALEAARERLSLPQIEIHELDLDEAPLPSVQVDGAWSRWVFAFVTRPRELLAQVASVIKPGGALVLHEYFDYSTWRFSPRSPEMEELVEIVMKGWRATGGEPDIGLDLPGWLEEVGFEVKHTHPLIDIVSPSSFVWQWPKTFVAGGLNRLIELNALTPERAKAIADAFAALEAAPHTRMITPAVLEIIAVRR